MLSLKYNPYFTEEEEQVLRTTYRDSFPVDERRPEEAIFVVRDSGLNMCALYNEGKIVGLITYWSFVDFVFIEHFFILTEYRSKGYGTVALQLFKQEQGKCIVLECELPITDIAQRRVAFYQSLGYQRLDTTYYQPPYQPGGAYVNMYLMATKSLAREEMKAYIRKIYSSVYRHKYEAIQDIF